MAELTNAKALRVQFVYPLAATLFRVVDVAGVAKSDSTNLEGILPGSRRCCCCCSVAQCTRSYKNAAQVELVIQDILRSAAKPKN